MSAAVNLRVPQDYGLVIAGILGSVLILIRNRKAGELSIGCNTLSLSKGKARTILPEGDEKRGGSSA
jgi:hypothetical protein